MIHPSRLIPWSLGWLAAVLSGCASAPYQPPPGAPKAQIRMVSTGAANAFVIVGHAPECKPERLYRHAALGVASTWSDLQRLDMPLPPALPPSQWIEVEVEADRTLTVLGSSTQVAMLSVTAPVFDRCQAAAYFRAKADDRYEMMFDRTTQGCTVTVSRLTPSAEGSWLREPVPSLPKPPSSCP